MAIRGRCPRSRPPRWRYRTATLSSPSCFNNSSTPALLHRNSSPTSSAPAHRRRTSSSCIWAIAKRHTTPSNAPTASCRPTPRTTVAHRQPQPRHHRTSGASRYSTRSRARSGRATTPTATRGPGTGAPPRQSWCSTPEMTPPLRWPARTQAPPSCHQARVVVTEGAGHTSMYVASTCTERVKRNYLFTAVLPPVGTSCSRDRSPFD